MVVTSVFEVSTVVCIIDVSLCVVEVLGDGTEVGMTLVAVVGVKVAVGGDSDVLGVGVVVVVVVVVVLVVVVDDGVLILTHLW